MKYVRQFLIILVISFIGELLRYYIPLKIPASIYGLVLLFAALELRIIKLVSIIVMAVSGKVTQGVIRMEKKHPKKKNGADHIYVKDSEGERQYISENSI